MLKSKYFLNLDNEEKDTICIGCAGGVKTTARRKIALRDAKGDTGWRIKISGLQGGHSGVDIHQGRGNAVRILAGVLQTAMETLPHRDREPDWRQRPECDSARGVGSRRRWMPAREPELESLIKKLEGEYKTDLGGFDPDLQVTVEKVERPKRR